MKLYNNKIFPKIDWAKMRNKLPPKEVLGNEFDYQQDNVVGCYTGLINDKMINEFKTYLNEIEYKNKLLVIATSEENSETFRNNGIISIYCHKAFLEISIQNFNIIELPTEFDIISVSRQDKRKYIEQFLNYNFCSLTWDGVHFPVKEAFKFFNKDKLKPSQICEFINKSKFGYFCCDDECEIYPLLEFWLCGVPVITNIENQNSTRGKICNDMNSILYNKFEDNKKFDKSYIRENCLKTIMKYREYVNTTCKEMEMTSNCFIQEIENFDRLPRW